MENVWSRGNFFFTYFRFLGTTTAAVGTRTSISKTQKTVLWHMQRNGQFIKSDGVMVPLYNAMEWLFRCDPHNVYSWRAQCFGTTICFVRLRPGLMVERVAKTGIRLTSRGKSTKYSYPWGREIWLLHKYRLVSEVCGKGSDITLRDVNKHSCIRGYIMTSLFYQVPRLKLKLFFVSILKAINPVQWAVFGS